MYTAISNAPVSCAWHRRRHRGGPLGSARPGAHSAARGVDSGAGADPRLAGGRFGGARDGPVGRGDPRGASRETRTGGDAPRGPRPHGAPHDRAAAARRRAARVHDGSAGGGPGRGSERAARLPQLGRGARFDSPRRARGTPPRPRGSNARSYSNANVQRASRSHEIPRAPRRPPSRRALRSPPDPPPPSPPRARRPRTPPPPRPRSTASSRAWRRSSRRSRRGRGTRS